MHVCLVSTWRPQRCGIAEYSRNLALALSGLGVRISVIAEMLDTDISTTSFTDDGIPVQRAWKRTAPVDSPRGVAGILRVLGNIKPDVVHVQHEHAIWPFAEDLFQLLRARQRSVVTLHTVHERPQNRQFYRGLAATNAVHIVHSLAAAARLLWPCEVIPHGVPEPNARREDARAVLKLPEDECVALLPGFISSSKRIDLVLDAMSRADLPSAFHLYIVGLCRETHVRENLESNINGLSLNNHVTLVPQYQASEERGRWFAAADLVVLSRAATTPYSASGEIAMALGYGLPVLARDVPIHQGNGDGVLLWQPENLGALLERISVGTLLGRLAEAARKTASERTWPLVAKQHLGVYSRA